MFLKITNCFEWWISCRLFFVIPFGIDIGGTIGCGLTSSCSSYWFNLLLYLSFGFGFFGFHRVSPEIDVDGGNADTGLDCLIFVVTSIFFHVFCNDCFTFSRSSFSFFKIINTQRSLTWVSSFCFWSLLTVWRKFLVDLLLRILIRIFNVCSRSWRCSPFRPIKRPAL